MAWTAPSTWVSGAILTAAQLNQQLRDNMLELAPFFAAWTAHTPVWTNVTVGNGTNTGRYVQVGKLVIYQGQLTWGSTTSATASNTTVALPVTANTTTGISFIGNSYINDTGTRFYSATCYRGSATTLVFIHSGDAGTGIVTGTAPMTWTTGDLLAWQVVYEAA